MVQEPRRACPFGNRGTGLVTVAHRPQLRSVENRTRPLLARFPRRALTLRGPTELPVQRAHPRRPRCGLLRLVGAQQSELDASKPTEMPCERCRQTPRPIHPTIVYHSNSNKRRESLGWTEATVLEAVGWFQFGGEPWSECLETLLERASAAESAGTSILRPSMLLWASETEKGASVEARHRIEVIADALLEAVPSR